MIERLSMIDDWLSMVDDLIDDRYFNHIKKYLLPSFFMIEVKKEQIIIIIDHQ